MSKIKKINYMGTDYDISTPLYYATPQDYGAKADGTTDDTLAIQYAISNNYAVCFPKGHYRITSPIVFTRNQCHVFGADNSNTRIKCDGCGGFVLNGRQNIVIKNIKIYGSNSPQEPGINIDGSTSYCIFDEIMIDSFPVGIKANSANMSHVTNITIQNCKIISCDNGIELMGTSECQVNIISILNNEINGATNGILCCGNKINIIGNDFENCEYGINCDSKYALKDNDYRNIYSLSIENNYFDWISKTAIRLDAHWKTGDHCLINGVVIVGNYIYAPQYIMQTEYPLIDMRSSQKVYSDHNTGGYMLTGLVFEGNTTSIPSQYIDQKVLFDGGNCLDTTSIIIISQEGNLQSNNEYIIQNTGNAKVVHKFGKAKDIIKLYKYAAPAGAEHTDTGIELASGNVFRFEIEQNGVAKSITIPVDSDSSAVSSTIEMYGYKAKTGEKISLGSQTFTSSDESVVFGYNYVTNNNTMFEKEFLTYEFVVTVGNGVTAEIGNPTYEYYVQ